MKKVWEEIAKNVYSFTKNDHSVGTLEIVNNVRDVRAYATLGADVYAIRATGFWKTSLEILTSRGQIVARISPQKWYSSSLLVEYRGYSYHLKLRNRPLAEWVLLDQDTEVLSYGLVIENGKASVRITSRSVHSDNLLDFLLFYQFRPLLEENSNDIVVLV
jgi:hypothetical protein